jgi:carbon-monoxide dehydrogenase small subunit
LDLARREKLPLSTLDDKPKKMARKRFKSGCIRLGQVEAPFDGRFCYTLLFSRAPTSGMFALSEVAMNVSMSINGKNFSHEVEPRLLLIHYLREVVGLTGSHIGCETSLCGACTIELNGRAVKSCSIFAVQADGARITTIEGLASDGRLHGVQQAFWNEHALQCGFCTPGMIMTSKQIIERNPNPTEEEIREGLSGNICRCTGYQHIVNAVKAAAVAAVE